MTEKEKGRLSGLRPRDTREARSRSLAYSRFVGVLRWVLPLLVVCGLAALTIWPIIKERQLATLVIETVPNLMVEHLHLTGRDENNQAYSLTAKRALQAEEPANKNLVDLEKPEAEISLNDGAWLAGHAAYGRLDQATEKLWLGGKVEFFHDQGYSFLSDEAYVDMEKKAAWGEKPVLIQGGFGEIRGSGFRFLDGGNALVVTGPATAKLDLQHLEGSDKPSGKNSTSR